MENNSNVQTNPVVESDSKQSRPKKGLGKFFKIGFLVVLVGLAGFFVYEYFRIKPNDVRFTNITSSSVTVSWNTKSPTSGTALVFEGDTWMPVTVLGLGGERFYDTRDVREAELEAVDETVSNISVDGSPSIDDFEVEIVVENMGDYFTHHVVITGLNPEQEYSFFVGDMLLSRRVEDDTGRNVVETTSVQESIETPLPAYGTILDAQGLEDPQEEEILELADAVVYVNYFSETDETRSVMTSSPINEDGNWYVDVSTLEDFRKTKEEIITNIWAEITIDAGPLGLWRKKFPFDRITPTEVIVLNDPGMRQDDDTLGVLRLRSGVLGSFVQETAAASCNRAGFCGPCYGSSLADSCPCPYLPSTCKGESTKTIEKIQSEMTTNQAAKAKGQMSCAGDASPGKVTWVSSKCKICDGSTGLWKDTDNSRCGQKTQTVQTPVENIIPPSGEELLPEDLPAGEWGNAETIDDGSVVLFSLPHCDALKYRPGEAPRVNGKTVFDNVSDCEEGNPDLQNDDKEFEQTGGEDGEGENDDNGGGLGGDFISSPLPTRVTMGGEEEVDAYIDVSTKTTEEEQADSKTEKGTLTKVLDATGAVASTWISLMREVVPAPFNADFVILDELLEVAEEKDFFPKYQIEAAKIGEKGLDALNRIIDRMGEEFQNVQEVRRDELDTSNPFVNDGLVAFNSLINPAGVSADASSSGTREYLVDQNTGTISGITAGLHTFEYEGEAYAFYVDPQVVEGQSVDVLLYIDQNDNGTYDENTDILVSEYGTRITVSTLVRQYKYTLAAGFNFVSFPFVFDQDDMLTASGLIKKINEYAEDNIVYSIAKYDGRWKIVGQNTKVYDSNDFRLIPGQGYVIRMREDFDIMFDGEPVRFESSADSAPITFFEGWNLIGLYGTDVKRYTADSLLREMGGQGFTANNVSKWESAMQRYEGYQLDGSDAYGFDYPLNKGNAYFVRVLEGRGNWQPKLKTQ
jgi:hypothetical protein